MKTLPFLMTGLHPSQRRLTDERVFIPRASKARIVETDVVGDNVSFDKRNCGLERRSEENSRVVGRARREGWGWGCLRYWRMVRGRRGRRRGNILLVLFLKVMHSDNSYGRVPCTDSDVQCWVM